MDFISQIPSVAIDEVCLHKEYAALTDITKIFPDSKGEVNTYKTDQCRLGNKGQKMGARVKSEQPSYSTVCLTPAKSEYRNETLVFELEEVSLYAEVFSP